MTRDEVIELFKFLKYIYPNFEVSSEKVDVWARMMKKMDFKRVMVKAEQHASENKFPPTIAEIAAYAPEKNTHKKKIAEWKEEAKKVSPTKKAEFAKKLQELSERLSQNDSHSG